VISFLLLPYGEPGILLLLLTLFVSIIGLVSGVTYAVGASIILFFTVGSIIFWIGITEVQLFNDHISILYITYWMAAQLIIAIVSGSLSGLFRNELKENEHLKKEIQTLVAVDSVTGFDNKVRMFVEIELEYNRAQRYGQTFSFILIKWNFFEQFQKLYGEAEVDLALRHIAKQLYKHTRDSDQKFRAEDDMFALLLPNTDVSNVELVIEKLNREMAVFELQNNKFVTLTFEYGYVGFDEDIGSYIDIYETALEQVG